MATDQACRKRPLRALLLAVFFVLPGTVATAAEPVARVVTRVDAEISPSAVIVPTAKTDTELNRALDADFRNALDGVGRLAMDGAFDPLRLIYHAEAFGNRVSSDASIGRVEGNAGGAVDFELKLWTSGDGSSLFQGRSRSEKITSGLRLNALLVQGDTILWQGYLLTSPDGNTPAEALGPLVQTLVDRLEISVDETIPLR